MKATRKEVSSKAKAKTLDELVSKEMTTEEIFQAWGILQDYAADILTSVQNRLKELEADGEAGRLTQEQQDLLELEEALENMLDM